MIDFKQILILLLTISSSIHFGNAQNEPVNTCQTKILTYLDGMEKIATPQKEQVYYMKFTTKVAFHDSRNFPDTSTQTEVLTSQKKIAMVDPNMQVYGDDKEMFVILPKVRKIYWNASDPRLFAENNTYKKFLDIERAVLKTAKNVHCTEKEKVDHIVIIPGKEIENKTGLIKQILTYDRKTKTVTTVENSFNTNNKIKTQVVHYQVIDYKSTKNIKEALKYVFTGTQVKPAFKDFKIIDNRKNK